MKSENKKHRKLKTASHYANRLEKLKVHIIILYTISYYMIIP